MSWRRPRMQKRPGKCFNCGLYGHWANTCQKKTGRSRKRYY